jgi:hypothetical protein
MTNVNLEPDTGVRAKFGIVVSLVELSDGTTRVVLDDVSSREPKANTAWTFDTFYTHKRLPSGELDRMALSKDEYEGLGVAVLARLLALNGRVSPDEDAT